MDIETWTCTRGTRRSPPPRSGCAAPTSSTTLVWNAEKWGIECTNFEFDTCLVGNLFDENRSDSLNLHAKLMTGMGGYDDAFDDERDTRSLT